ncbi:hypothetical protein GCM10010319_48430 [Streptomyces blastmyceticus]|uniref:Uncharacterized protein n=1 Tax=Streptomyces blastmyceticus TaxID=68180 RepID=A0ABN0XIB5_9ACTN
MSATVTLQDLVSGVGIGGAAVTGSCQVVPNSAGGAAAVAGLTPSNSPVTAAHSERSSRLMGQE